MKHLVRFLTVVEIEVDSEMDAAVEGAQAILDAFREATLPSENYGLEFCILSERKAYRLPDRPFGDRNARRNSWASRQVDHVLI